MRNQIVILAAGQGTRMGQSETPKVLVMLNNKPLVFYILEEIEKINQLAKPVVVVGYKHNQVKQILGQNYDYAFQERRLGTGHAVMSAEKKIIGDNILVLYGDMPFIKAESLKKLIRLHQTSNSNLTMFTTTVDNFAEYPSHYHYGRIIRDLNGNIIKITEFKDASPAERNLREVNPGIYMFNTNWLFNNIYKIQNQNAQGEYYLTDMVEIAIAGGQAIQSSHISAQEVFGINSPEEMKKAEQMLSVNVK